MCLSKLTSRWNFNLIAHYFCSTIRKATHRSPLLIMTYLNHFIVESDFTFSTGLWRQILIFNFMIAGMRLEFQHTSGTSDTSIDTVNRYSNIFINRTVNKMSLISSTMKLRKMNRTRSIPIVIQSVSIYSIILDRGTSLL